MTSKAAAKMHSSTPETIALREAGKTIKNDTESWVSSLIPTGDGLLLATKL